MPLKDSVKTNYASLQGDLLLAKRDSNGNPGSFFMIGNAPKIELSPKMERRKHKESRSGNRTVDKIQTTVKEASLAITFEDIRRDNVALLLSGKKVTISSGSFTSGSPDTFPSGLVVGSIVRLARPNVSSLVIKDSAGTPATLVLNTHYKVLDADYGLVEIVNLASFVQPFKAEYSYASTEAVTMFEANDDDEYFAYVAAINTEGTPDDQKLGYELYRCIFNVADLLALINEEQSSFNLTAEVLRDDTRASDASLGGFGRWIYVDANAT